MYVVLLYLQDKKGILAKPVRLQLSEEKNKKEKETRESVIFFREFMLCTVLTMYIWIYMVTDINSRS